MYWDDGKPVCGKSPLGDFFCCVVLEESVIVNSVPMAVVLNREVAIYFPMPFKKKAKITLKNQHANKIPAFSYRVDYCLYDGFRMIFLFPLTVEEPRATDREAERLYNP